MLELKVHDDDREVVLQFEHSLLSLSKWESKHHKAFLDKEAKQPIEMLEYFEDMLLTPDVDPRLVYTLAPEQFEELTKYIQNPMTASSIPKSHSVSRSSERVTSELIYYWMVELKIPFVAESWHLNRLMMLIQITNIKKSPPKKRPVRETMSDWAKLNESRKKQMNSNG